MSEDNSWRAKCRDCGAHEGHEQLCRQREPEEIRKAVTAERERVMGIILAQLDDDAHDLSMGGAPMQRFRVRRAISRIRRASP